MTGNHRYQIENFPTEMLGSDFAMKTLTHNDSTSLKLQFVSLMNLTTDSPLSGI